MKYFVSCWFLKENFCNFLLAYLYENTFFFKTVEIERALPINFNVISKVK